MTLLLSLATALAAAPTPQHSPDELAAKAAVDAAYGKEVPWAALCSAEVKVEGGAPARVIGVKRRETGCEPFGLWSNATFTPVAGGVKAVVAEAAWKASSPAQKDALLTAWVDGALLAFAAPTGTAKVAHASGRTQVTRSYLRRDGEAGKAADVTTVFDFDAAGALANRTDTVNRAWHTQLFVQKVAVSGVSDEVAQTGVESSGAGIRACWEEAWEADRTIAGFTRLEWTVAGGKATKVTEVDQSTMPAGVVTCIGNALQRTTWPADATGTVRYVFSLDRR
jgi:hypothetical protein